VLGPRVIVGAFGSAAYHDEAEGRNEVIPLPGSYMQVAVVDFFEPHTEFGPGGAFEYRNAWTSLGEYHQGLPSARPPACAKYRLAEVPQLGAPIDSLTVSPSITRPRDGYVSTSTTVAFKGTGEPFTSLKLYPVGHKALATTVSVGQNGTWAVTLRNLAPGVHEYVARGVAGTAGPSNTVRFEVG
jgi:hypothetical protein